MFSHHSHSGQFCKHASGTLEEVVLEAISKGFTVYGLTEHVPRYRTVDLYPEEAGLPLAQLLETFDSFVHEAHRLKAAYADRITLLVGLETEYITEDDLNGLDEILKRYEGRIEYVVGSVHHANTIPIDFDIATFNRAVESFASASATRALEGLFLAYFDAQYELMQRVQPEVIGHFDLCRLYQPDIRFRDYPDVWTKIERNVRYAIKYGALFELNAAAFRKGWDDAYPANDVVDVGRFLGAIEETLTKMQLPFQLIKSFGGRFTLSDDSHGPHAIGLNYRRLRDYVQRIALHELWYLGRETNTHSSGRCLKPILAEGDWCEPSTWGNVAWLNA